MSDFVLIPVDDDGCLRPIASGCCLVGCAILFLGGLDAGTVAGGCIFAGCKALKQKRAGVKK